MTELNKRITIDEPVIILIGPTAIGKTELSLDVSEQFGCEIVSVDSMQVYRYMDIGTAKASTEERARIPHHLIDVVTPDDEYNASRFVEDSLRAISAIHQRGHIPLLTGGTGLYLKSLLEGLFPDGISDQHIRRLLSERVEQEGSLPLFRELARHDPETAARIHENDKTRIMRALEVYLTSGIPLSQHIKRQRNHNRPVAFENIYKIGLTCKRPDLYDRINRRCRLMFDLGLEAEVRGLLEMGFGRELKAMQAIGYRHMVHFINREWTLEETLERLARDTRRYAKRQFTWFNRDESINWFERTDHSAIFQSISTWLDL